MLPLFDIADTSRELIGAHYNVYWLLLSEARRQNCNVYSFWIVLLNFGVKFVILSLVVVSFVADLDIGVSFWF